MAQTGMLQRLDLVVKFVCQILGVPLSLVSVEQVRELDYQIFGWKPIRSNGLMTLVVILRR